MVWKHFTRVLAISHLLQISLGLLYEALPERPMFVSLKNSDVNFDHVTLQYGVTVIAYGNIIESDISDNSSTNDVSLQNFVDQMTYLDVNGYHTISVTELFAYLTGNTVLPPRSVLLTFQESKTGVWDYVYPILRQKKFFAAIFVSPNNILENTAGQYMALDQLKVIDNEPLFEVYPSGKSGIPLTNDIRRDIMVEELDGARQWLEEQLGGSRPYFAWPEGKYSQASAKMAKRFYNMTFALDEMHDAYANRLHRIPRFVVKGRYDLPEFLRVLEGVQPNLDQNAVTKEVTRCFDLDVEVQGQELKEAMQQSFVPCSDVLFHANRLVTSQQLASLCVNIKKGVGLDGKDLETSSEVVASSSPLTRAGVVVSLYRCAKEAWLDFTRELPKMEIMNPFTDIDGSAYDGIVVALAGLCNVAAPPNDRGKDFQPSDWSSRGSAVVASWRMLGCLRELISPSEKFPNNFDNEEGIWKWLPSDNLPKAKDSASVAVAGSAFSLTYNFNIMMLTLFVIALVKYN